METTYNSDIGYIAEHESPNGTSACHLFGCCLRRYGALLLVLQTDDPRLTHLAPSSFLELKDEFSRLRVWGEQTYAVLPQNARRSLDAQLREDDDTKRIVTGSLQRLNNRIERATQQVEKHLSTATEGEEYSSSSGESDTPRESLEPTWEIRFRKIISSIFEGIRSLYRISVLLRRPRNSSKYLRSSKTTIPSQNALKVTLDYAHTLEKIRQWRQRTMRSKVGGYEEKVITVEEIQRRQEDEQRENADIVFFCQRLTWANLFRRKQFDYWVEYPDLPEFQHTGAQRNRLNGQTSTVIDAAFSSVAKSALGNGNDVGQSLTVYAKSVVGRPNASRVPDVPRCSKTDPNFECPYCHISLDSKLMQEREIWKKHVFRDLRPYVCSFENCPDPGRLFITRHDWIYHEQQMHRRKWICLSGCANDLPSKAGMIQHLLTEHSSTINERQVSTHADMCEREVNETGTDICLICREGMSTSRLYDHLATHMEELALFVLPLTPDDSPDEHIQELIENNSQPDSLTGEIEPAATADTGQVARKAAQEEFKKDAFGSDADEPPLKFTDALDRRFALPWHLVKTWKGMEILIRQAFVNIERIGPHVASGHYHLLGPNGEIILPQVWDIVVQPGWDIKMQMWPLPPDPLEAKVNSGIGGFPPDIIPVMVRPPRSSRSRPQDSGSKSAGKRASVGPAPPLPPPPAPAQHTSPLPPPMHMPSVYIGHDDHDDPVIDIFEESHSRGRSGSSGGKSSANSSKKKQVPAFTRWMLGGGTRSRPKGAENPTA